MKNVNTITVNFKGGCIPHSDLYNILLAAGKAGLLYVRFGLRQQLLLDVEWEELESLMAELNMLGVTYELNTYEYPNLMSSFPAVDVFLHPTWVGEDTYKEIMESFTYHHKLKINISDAGQSFTPLLTGNINWVASPVDSHFWHLFIRFPKTNIIYEWEDLVHTRDLAAMSQRIEETILFDARKFYDTPNASGEELYNLIRKDSFHTQKASSPLNLPPFNLPYYEGLNRYRDHFWLGIYRRDELFNIQFLKEACLLCRETGIAQIFSTPWKSVIIKGINERNRKDWNYLLDKYQINVRHAANELNFQVEDNSLEALQLKLHLVRYLNNDDTRTFGVCIGIKTRRKSEVFSSILVRKRYLFHIGKFGFFTMYDILCAKDFNPNERTDSVYSRNNPKFVLAEQLRRAVLSYYDQLGMDEEKGVLHSTHTSPPVED
ncbi:MAG: rubredoxin [Bacteroidota bacterium]|nr:rubredoxin [Bacteroidota bacterium]